MNLADFEPKENGILFDLKSYKIFQRYLKELAMKHQYEVEMIGANIADIGVRPIKKGSATYLCMGDTFAPHASAVFNKAVWTMLKFKDHYIRYEESGDKYIGRVVAGLPVFSKNYS